MGHEADGSHQIVLDGDLREARIDGAPAQLTPREFQLLESLMSRPSQVVAITELLEAIWGTASVGDGHAVEVYVSRLRRKLDRHVHSPEVIRTVRGRGYMFQPPPTRRTTVRLISDALLILREVDPDDQPFLGWEPSEVLDTFFLLYPEPWLHQHPHTARAVTSALVLAGIREISGPFTVRTADGDVRFADGNLLLHSKAGRFLGLEATLHL